jgi:hypothetical protein
MVLGDLGDEALGKRGFVAEVQSACPSRGGAPRAAAKSRLCVTSVAAAPQNPTGRCRENDQIARFAATSADSDLP